MRAAAPVAGGAAGVADHRGRSGRREQGIFVEGGVVRQSRRWWPLWLFVLVLLAWRTSAQAHLMNTGFGPFYDGLTHLFVTPEDLLPMVVLTLLAGLHGAQCGRWVLFTLP